MMHDSLLNFHGVFLDNLLLSAYLPFHNGPVAVILVVFN
jgi:hypothetical protein